jgi:hypothetical protein
MGCVPTLMPALITINNRNNFIDRGNTAGYLRQTLIQQSIKPALIETVNLTPKSSRTYPKNRCGLFLG